MNRLLVLILMIPGTVSLTHADVSVRRRAVEMFQLKDGTRLFGVALAAEDPHTIRILLRANWLRLNAPHLYASALDHRISVDTAANDVAQKLQAHIERLRTAADPDLERIGYLEERLTGLFPAVPNPADKADKADVVVLQIPESLVRQQLRKKPADRQLAGLGILNDIADVEAVERDSLRTALQKLPPDSLVRELPARLPQEQDTAAMLRVILLSADRVLGRTCRLIFQSGQYISEAAAAANPEALAVQLLSGSVQSQLQQLLGPEFGSAAARQPAARLAAVGDVLSVDASRVAERENADVVEVSQMDLDAGSGRVRVILSIYHKGTDSTEWRCVASVAGAADQTDMTAEQQQRIANDPRVRQVTQLFQGLGAGGNELNKAIAIGAVVEVAQQRARTELNDQLVREMQAPTLRLNVLEAGLNELPKKAPPQPEP